MAESTCLHIQDHESAPIRVVDIPWISVRIGRAAFCEVRLTAEDLADEACRLYRRGRSWHLVPAGGKSKSEIFLDGRPVDASRPLPFNVPFRIGRYCLTLRQDRAVDPDWGMYPGAMPAQPGWSTPAFEDGPIGYDHALRADLVVEPQSIVEAPFKSEWRSHGTAKGPVQAGEYPAPASVKDRWETRWRVAGAELKARAKDPAPRSEPQRPPFETGFETVPLKEPRFPRARPTSQAPPEPPARPVQTTEGVARVEPRWHVPTAESSEPLTLAPHLSDEAYLSDEWIARDSPTEALWSHAPHAGAKDHPSGLVPARPPEIEPSHFVPETDEPHHADNDESWYEMPVLVLPPEPTVSEAVSEAPGEPARTSRKRRGKDPSSTDSDRPRPASGRGSKSGDGKRAPTPRARIDREPRPVGAQRPEPDHDATEPQWPSAKTILASHRARTHGQMTSATAGRPKPEAGLTHSRGPAHWTMPGRLAGPPAAVILVAIGLVGGVLSWWWANDAYSVSIMTGRLMSADGKAQHGALPQSVAPPDGTWAHTTAQHLAHWAIFLCHNDPEHAPSPRDVAALLDRALQISPLNPTARLALAQFEPLEVGAPVSQRALGLSRDTISLVWCARRLLAAGDKDGALKIFEKALKMAAINEASRVPQPSFSDDPSIPRYLLPGEERVQEIVRELASHNEWTFREWSAALPKNPASILAAARLLKKQGRGEAETLLDLILDDRPVVEGAKPTFALDRAARAEALALKSRWRESEEQYRLAIELIDDDTIKRTWWFNLADIELRLDDERQRQTALRAALADTSDDISRRATEIQRTATGRPLTRSSGPKAN